MEEKEILKLFQNRSEQAVQEVARQFGRYCYSIAYRIVDSPSDAEECVNDTWFAAWKAIPPARPNSLAAFLGRLTRNIALDRVDYNTAAKRNREMTCILSELEECLSGGETAEQQYEDGQIAEEISRCLYTMNPENRMMFVRRYWYADSVREIAVRFGVRESKVKSSLFRTRKKLKQYLIKEGIQL